MWHWLVKGSSLSADKHVHHEDHRQYDVGVHEGQRLRVRRLLHTAEVALRLQRALPQKDQRPPEGAELRVAARLAVPRILRRRRLLRRSRPSRRTDHGHRFRLDPLVELVRGGGVGDEQQRLEHKELCQIREHSEYHQYEGAIRRGREEKPRHAQPEHEAREGTQQGATAAKAAATAESSEAAKVAEDDTKEAEATPVSGTSSRGTRTTTSSSSSSRRRRRRLAQRRRLGHRSEKAGHRKEQPGDIEPVEALRTVRRESALPRLLCLDEECGANPNVEQRRDERAAGIISSVFFFSC